MQCLVWIHVYCSKTLSITDVYNAIFGSLSVLFPVSTFHSELWYHMSMEVVIIINCILQITLHSFHTFFNEKNNTSKHGAYMAIPCGVFDNRNEHMIIKIF